eukprot:CAMPEP_0116059618 /NCGR_PEP_ID=MMETSP0322-20121206/5901_1 /TAXON_ID=163516 /ORGANISM="Leptocylindrus danicus var. apora, Strain B651" /LENGTH=325 /DNA_ID=CAMNT_0003544029 /DNA_START=73 /DNA_END=1047 /DNA_ORIENTATION=+
MARPSKKSNVLVTLRYMSAAAVALLLTIASPRTKLWDNGLDSEVDQNYTTLNVGVLMDLVIVSVLTIISFFAVQGSDPGYLDDGIMVKACEQFSLMSQNNPQNRSQLNLLGDVGAMELELSPALSSNDGRCEEDEEKQLILMRHSPPRQNSGSSNLFYKKRLRSYCAKCKFAPPLRAHHCKECDICVATFDHHCHFIGTCIGERNHCRFWWFVTFQFIAFSVMISIITSRKQVFIRKEDEDTKFDWILDNLIIVFTTIYLWPLFFSAMIVWGSQTWFALSNTTTFEFIKGRNLEYLQGIHDCDLPFSNGFDQNIRDFCCLRDKAW